MNRTLLCVLVAAALVALGAAGGHWWANRHAHDAAAPAPATAAPGDAKAPDGRKVLYWHDPMYPQQKFDKPGRSPFMDMDLVPVYAEDGADAGGVKVSPRVVQNLGMRTATAEKGRLEIAVQAVGTVAFDERAVTVVQSRTAGYIEKLFVRAPLDPVKKGQPLVELDAVETHKVALELATARARSRARTLRIPSAWPGARSDWPRSTLPVPVVTARATMTGERRL